MLHKTRYVQEGTITPNDTNNIVGIDQLVDYRYMGSAEYEYGALIARIIFLTF